MLPPSCPPIRKHGATLSATNPASIVKERLNDPDLAGTIVKTRQKGKKFSTAVPDYSTLGVRVEGGAKRRRQKSPVTTFLPSQRRRVGRGWRGPRLCHASPSANKGRPVPGASQHMAQPLLRRWSRRHIHHPWSHRGRLLLSRAWTAIRSAARPGLQPASGTETGVHQTSLCTKGKVTIMENVLLFTGALACVVGVVALLEGRFNCLGFGRPKKE